MLRLYSFSIKNSTTYLDIFFLSSGVFRHLFHNTLVLYYVYAHILFCHFLYPYTNYILNKSLLSCAHPLCLLYLPLYTT